jgi:hypothetical protein
MPSTLTTSYEWAQQMLTLASAALETTIGGAIERQFVAGGLPALDCCPQLTVHTSGYGLFPTNTPGVLTPGHRRTVGSVRWVRFTVTVVRCAAVPGVKGAPPTPEAQAAIAEILNQDAYSIIDAAVKADNAGTLFGGACREFIFEGANSLDPAGGCVGWVINFRTAIEGLANGA